MRPSLDFAPETRSTTNRKGETLTTPQAGVKQRARSLADQRLVTNTASCRCACFTRRSAVSSAPYATSWWRPYHASRIPCVLLMERIRAVLRRSTTRYYTCSHVWTEYGNPVFLLPSRP